MKRKVLLSLAGFVVAAGLVVLAIVGWMVFQPGPYAFAGGAPVALSAYQGPAPTGVPAELANADKSTRDAYVTSMADCQACHTAPGGKPFAGGRAFVLPFGTIYTPNLTPDPETGIGKWTDAQFLAAVHRGVSPDGSHYYPAFPYPSYTMLSDQDVLAIKAYLFSLPPVKQTNKPNTFGFPYNQRWLMAIWSTLFNPNERFRPVPEQSPAWNRGAYLVEAAGHCAECHTPRNLMQSLDHRKKFGGAQAEGWNAYNISSDKVSGIGDWSADELAAYLSSGHARGRGVASGPMGEAVELSLSRLSKADIDAIVTYLRSVPAVKSDLPAPAGPAVATPQISAIDNPVGKRMFESNCAGCHAWSGAGAAREEAQLTGLRAINDPSGVNVVQMILHGSGASSAHRAYMPDFGKVYSNDEIAAVTNYITARFGARASKLTAADIARLREAD